MQQAWTVVSHILARFLCSQTGYPALMASRTERLHSSMSRTWKTPKPSMGIFRPLCKVADGSRGDGVDTHSVGGRLQRPHPGKVV